MSYSLSLRPRALAEIEKARDGYAQVDHSRSYKRTPRLLVAASMKN
jgi:hypothetical protein